MRGAAIVAQTDNPINDILCIVLFVYWLVLLVRVILSWLQFAGWRPPSTGLLRAAYDVVIDVTEPPLRLLRKVVPPAGVIDLSVLVAFVALFVLRTVFC